MGKLLLFTLACGLLAGGCSSRWAMSEPAYYNKYSRPYEEGEKLPRMAKQTLDARHVAHRTGGYVNTGAALSPITVGGELGLMHFTEPWQEYRLGLAGLLGTGGNGWYGGFDGGARLHPPSRIAPFVGAGAFAGWNEVEVSATGDGIDNDADLFTDERGETRDESNTLLAGYPEIGLHLWLTPRVRLSGMGRYYVTTEGRDSDFWYAGIGLSFLPPADINDWNNGQHDQPSWEVSRLPDAE